MLSLKRVGETPENCAFKWIEYKNSALKMDDVTLSLEAWGRIDPWCRSAIDSKASKINFNIITW